MLKALEEYVTTLFDALGPRKYYLFGGCTALAGAIFWLLRFDAGIPTEMLIRVLLFLLALFLILSFVLLAYAKKLRLNAAPRVSLSFMPTTGGACTKPHSTAVPGGSSDFVSSSMVQGQFVARGC